MSEVKVGEIIEGTVIEIRKFGAIMIFPNGYKGLLHISEVADAFIRNLSRYLTIGKTYQVKVLEIADDKFLKVSMAKISQEEKEMYRNQSLKRTPVEDEYIDFTALEAKLKEWTKQGD